MRRRDATVVGGPMPGYLRRYEADRRRWVDDAIDIPTIADHGDAQGFAMLLQSRRRDRFGRAQAAWFDAQRIFGAERAAFRSSLRPPSP